MEQQTYLQRTNDAKQKREARFNQLMKQLGYTVEANLEPRTEQQHPHITYKLTPNRPIKHEGKTYFFIEDNLRKVLKTYNLRVIGVGQEIHRHENGDYSHEKIHLVATTNLHPESDE